MRKIIINDNQRGLLFKNGRFVKPLKAGRYFELGDREIEVLGLSMPVASKKCAIEALLMNPDVAAQTTSIRVADQQIALHYLDSRLDSVLQKGRHAFWNADGKHEFKLIDISSPVVSEDVTPYELSKIPSYYYTKIEVNEFERAKLYFDRKPVRILDAGVYYFWNGATKIHAEIIDTRLTQMSITGQEMLTSDKVTLRVNFVCNYRVTDFEKVNCEIDDFREQLHVACQLALREYVARYKLDEILENREEMSAFVLERLKSRESELFIEISDAGVKDIILPGEIREIMNTVLVAEKRAQANVIARREEVASTRSLLNTAKLMDENQTLYKLKELEYIERICENVGQINISGGDILSQITGILRGN